MIRPGLVVLVCCVLAVIAFLSGRAFERAYVAKPAVSVVPQFVDTKFPEPPADFGERFHADVGSLPFADVYETLSSADARIRSEWLRQIENTPESPRKIAALCEFFRALVQIDPRMAADFLVGLKRHRSPVMEGMFLSAPPSAMPQLADLMLRLPDDVRYYHSFDNLVRVVGEWAGIDPRAAADFVDQHQDNLRFDQYAYVLLGSWGEMDPEASLKWMQRHSDNDLNSGQTFWLRGWFTADPNAATAYALMHANDPLMTDAIPRIASGVFDRDQLAANQYVQALPNPKMRQEALEDIISSLAFPDLDGEASTSAAVKFILQFPDTEWPDDFSKALNQWQKDASSELYDWIASLPPDVQSKVIENFPGPEWRDEESSFRPVLQMKNLDLRHKLLQRMIAELKREEEFGSVDSAQGVISKMSISEDYKEELSVLLRDLPNLAAVPSNSGGTH